MSEHLRPVFEIILPSLEGKVDYWVYGGVAIAGVKGSFFRENSDVDIFVYEEDYLKAIDLIKRSGTQLKSDEAPLIRNKRPKMDFYIGEVKSEIFSVIPIYKLDDGKIKFIYQSDFIPKNNLTKVVRTIGNYKFITSNTEFIKEQFMRKIGGKLAKQEELSEKTKKDAKVLFGKNYYEEVKNLYFKNGMGKMDQVFF